AFLGDVAEEDGQAAIRAEGMGEVADDTVCAVGVELVPAGGLAEGGLGGDAARCGAEEGLHGGGGVAGDVPAVERLAHGLGVDGAGVAVDEAGAVEFAEDGGDAAGAVDVFDVDVLDGGGDLAQAGDAAGEAVDVGHGEGDAAFLGGGQQVEHG